MGMMVENRTVREKWDDVAKVRTLMSEQGINKTPAIAYWVSPTRIREENEFDPIRFGSSLCCGGGDGGPTLGLVVVTVMGLVVIMMWCFLVCLVMIMVVWR
ncbi:hypothetical protein QYF36_004695 [Acer negundo]|nr:hypothetical protein QYF36_004695 [Acer negundo]